MARRKPAYFGITAFSQVQRYDRKGNERHGMNWHIISGPAPSIATARDKAYEYLGPRRDDIYIDTMYKNLTIVTRSELKQFRIKENEQ